MWGVAAGEGAVMVSVSSVFEWSVSRQCLVTWVEMCVSVRLRVCDEEPGAMGIQTVGQKGCHRGQIWTTGETLVLTPCALRTGDRVPNSGSPP